MKNRIALKHVHTSHIAKAGCQGIAFYLTRPLRFGDTLQPQNVILLDGTRPKMGDYVICGTCKRHVNIHELEQITETGPAGDGNTDDTAWFTT